MLKKEYGRRPSRFYNRRGMTLVEVMYSLLILTLCTLGCWGALLQTRRQTETDIRESFVFNAMQGIMEQIRNRPFSDTDLPLSDASVSVTKTNLGKTPVVPIPKITGVIINGVATDLYISPLPVLNLSTQITAGAIPVDKHNGLGDLTGDGVEDVALNTLTFDVNNSPSTAADNITVYLWIWVSDYTTNSKYADSGARGIVMIFTWQSKAGTMSRSFKGTLSSIKTAL